jgi:hypothetical protein
MLLSIGGRALFKQNQMMIKTMQKTSVAWYAKKEPRDNGKPMYYEMEKGVEKQMTYDDWEELEELCTYEEYILMKDRKKKKNTILSVVLVIVVVGFMWRDSSNRAPYREYLEEDDYK